MASIYDKSILSASDLDRLDEIIGQWKGADDKKKKALHDSAEAIRNSYGYSGGEDGHGFLVTDSALFTTSMSGNAYTQALEKAADTEQKAYGNQIEAVKKGGDERLKEAYVKNMQDTLGLGQKLKSAGITGGATESTAAYLNNVYNTARQDIINDTQEQVGKIQSEAIKSASDKKAEIAKAELERADKRADAIKSAEKSAYEREQDAIENDFKNRELDFKIAADARDFEYKKQTDTRDFEYQKAQDEYQKAEAKKKAAASASKSSSSSSKSDSMSVSNILSLIKAGVYRDDFADALGISKDELKNIVKSYSESEKREMAWKLLQNGVYHESFPELLDYPEDALRNYANSYLLGY